MTLAWIDAGNGAAGDMLLAALLDAGADRDRVWHGLAALPLAPVPVTTREVRRHGLRALRVIVDAPVGGPQRGLQDVLAVVAASALPAPVTEFASSVFTKLAHAEAAVHGADPGEIHFHEVGALDAIVDVIGCGLALHSLGLLGVPVTVSAVAVGSDAVSASHGRLTVPAPAVLRILADAGAPVAAHPGRGELCTPTGAALLTTLAAGYGPLPGCVPTRIGVGAGTKDPPGHANVLRVVMGSAAPPEPAWMTHDMTLVEATVDDLDPRLWPEVLAAMRAVGAVDAWCVPALTHKGRPGQVLAVLTAPDYLDAVCREVFRQTSSLGLRVCPVQRRSLPRDRVVVTHAGGEVGVKRAWLEGAVVTAEPEYDEAKRAAARTGQPVRQVLAEVREAAREAPAGTSAEPLCG